MATTGRGAIGTSVYCCTDGSVGFKLRNLLVGMHSKWLYCVSKDSGTACEITSGWESPQTGLLEFIDYTTLAISEGKAHPFG